MFSIKAIAELVYKRLNPGGSPEFPHEYEEVLETVKQKYGYLVWLNNFQGKKDPDLKMSFESMLKPFTKVIQFDNEGMFITLDPGVIDLPRDSGITNVRQNKRNCVMLAKSQASSYQMYAKSTISKCYYRIGNTIRFPYGMPDADIKEVSGLSVTTGSIDDDIMVGDGFADVIREEVFKNYFGGASQPEDKVADRNPNTEIRK